MKASEDVVALRKEFETTERMSPTYRSLLTQSQQIFGEEVIPSIEVDGHGLLLDCTFVGLPGQIAFFQRSLGTSAGLMRKLTEALDLATSWGYADRALGFRSSRL